MKGLLLNDHHIPNFMICLWAFGRLKRMVANFPAGDFQEQIPLLRA